MGNERLKVLIVDDSDLVVRRLLNILRDIKGVESTGHASNYNEAILMVEHTKPDLLLLDIQLPQKSGIDVLLTVKKNIKK